MAIIGFPQWFQSVWSLGSTDAPIPVIRDWLKTVPMPTLGFSGYWITVPVGIMMFGLLWYELRSQRIVQTTSIHIVKEPIPLTTSTPIPDWNIRELFFYIRPDLVEDHTDHTWEKVGLDIRDKLSTGQLKIWGRLDSSDRKPLSEISPEYWQSAEFTYWFLSDEEGSRFLVHVTPGIYHQHANLPSYRDLQVNKAQAMTIIDAARLAEQKVGFNKATFERNPTKENVILRLAQLRSEGVAIRNEAHQMLFTTHLDAWTTKVTDWMKEVIETLEAKNAVDSEWFATLGEVPEARVPIPNLRLGGQTDRETFVAIFRQHDFRLARLDKLLTKYGVGA